MALDVLSFARPLSGTVFPGEVEVIWQGAGQLLPGGTLPTFDHVPTEVPQGQFAVAIRLDGEDHFKFTIGTQGRSTIYTNPASGFLAMRRIECRGYSLFNWLDPFSG